MVAARQQDNDQSQYIEEGTPLSATRRLGSIATNMVDLHVPEHQIALDGPCLFLYLPDGKEPLELRNIAVVTLGRGDRYSDVQPMVDLSNHHAKLLGVSRIHAQIVYHNDRYYIRDLNSTNGTWVNRDKIEPDNQAELLSGDTIRLGHLMIQVGGC